MCSTQFIYSNIITAYRSKVTVNSHLIFIGIFPTLISPVRCMRCIYWRAFNHIMHFVELCHQSYHFLILL